MARAGRPERILAVRRFNRFITRHIGALNEGLLNSRFSLAEMRVLYEVNHREMTTAASLAEELGLDRGYLSRILKKFRDLHFIESRASEADGRQSELRVTELGRKEYRPFNDASSREVEAILDALSEAQELEVVGAMETVERLLGGHGTPAGNVVIRPHGIGDLGWIVHRQASLYAAEWGWDQSFEGLLAGIVSTFVTEFNPAREVAWIAELDGRIVGSAFVVDGGFDDASGDAIAKLRLVYVEPSARGRGIGKALVDQCIRFARDKGYARLTLWTNDNLDSARRIYERAGFQLESEEPHHSFGQDLVGQYWSLTLRPPAPERW